MKKYVDECVQKLHAFLFSEEEIPDFCDENSLADLYILKLFIMDFVLFYTLQKKLDIKSNMMKEIYQSFFDAFPADNLVEYIDYWFSIFSKEVNDPDFENVPARIGAAYAMVSTAQPEEITEMGVWFSEKFKAYYQTVKEITTPLFKKANP